MYKRRHELSAYNPQPALAGLHAQLLYPDSYLRRSLIKRMNKMVPYLQLERVTAGAIPTNGTLVFDTTVGSNSTHISYNSTTGIIEFNKVGVFYLSWFVAQQTGLATDGKNFALVTSDGQNITGSSHAKTAPVSGFAIVEVASSGKTIELVNKSDESATLSERVHVQAGLAVFDISASNLPLGYLQAQMMSPQSPIVEDNTHVQFDDEIAADPFGIVTLESSDIIINSTGTFLVTWEIPIDATKLNPYAFFALMVNGAQRGSSFMPLPAGVMTGSALIVVEEAGAVVKLVNISGDRVSVAHPVNITVTQISNI